MKTAVILAGGLGTRLHPLTLEIPKPLIPVQGKTLTEQSMDVIKEAGIKTIYLSIGHMGDRIKEYFGDGSKFGVDMKYIIEDEPLGTAGWMRIVDKNHPDFDEDFIVINGDNLFNIDLNEVLAAHNKNDALVTIALTKVEDPSPYGVAKLDGNKILEFVEKPKKEEAPSNCINSGYYIFSKEVFNILPDKKKIMFERDIFPQAASIGRLFGFPSDAQWFDTGTFERWECVIKEWRKL